MANEAEKIVQVVADKLDPEANIIWGTQIDESLQNMVRTTVVVSGIDANSEPGNEPDVDYSEESGETESFEGNLLEYPQYSRPAVWHGREVPAILLSGNHEKVRQWRRKQSLRRTRERRPDMYAKLDLSSKQDKKLLKEMEAEDAENK